MKEMEYLEELTSRYPVLEAVKGDVLAAYEILRDCYAGGGKLMIAGNGGSCADSEHIVGELMKGFVKRRPVSNEFAAALQEADEKRGKELASCLQGGLPAIALTAQTSITRKASLSCGKVAHRKRALSFAASSDTGRAQISSMLIVG